MAKADISVLRVLAEYRVLTVSQLTELAFVSEQMARRWIRQAEREGWVVRHAGILDAGRGRPEALVQLSKGGSTLLATPGGASADPLDARWFRHQILINRFRIELRKIDRAEFSVQFRSASLPNAEAPDVNGGHLIPDGVFSIASRRYGESLLFFLEADCATESAAGAKGADVRTKIINYREMLGHGRYGQYSGLFGAQFRGFRVLFVTLTVQRCEQLCRLARNVSPSDFVWVTNQDRVTTEGVGGRIWHRGGRDETESILGSCDPASQPRDHPVKVAVSSNSA